MRRYLWKKKSSIRQPFLRRRWDDDTPYPMNDSTSIFQDTPQLELLGDIARAKKADIYLVGGFWRDYLLGRRELDFDFAVSKKAIEIARLFAGKTKGAFVILDKERGCARVVLRRKAKTAKAESHSPSDKSVGERKMIRPVIFDFADFRAPTIQKDLSHRDFTINTLCVDLAKFNKTQSLSEFLLDFKGGLRDLKAKKIKMVAVRSFREDPLRLIRAFSLRAALGFEIEKKTLAQIKKDRDLLAEVSYERIRDEFFKILAADRACDNLKAMDKIGLLERMIPQVRVMYHVPQGGYHHLDVWPHSLQAIAELEKILNEAKGNPELVSYLNEPLAADRPRFALIKLAALLHDIGKPQTKKIEGGRTSFHGHEWVGKKITSTIGRLLKLSRRERYALEDMVLWHLRPGYLSNFKKPTPRAVFRYFRDTKEEGLSILLLSLADQRATRGPLTTEYDQRHHEEIIKDLIKYHLEKKKEKPMVRLISGHDLIQKLKLKPGPIFAKILREVEEKQAMGDVLSKEEALALARTIAK